LIIFLTVYLLKQVIKFLRAVEAIYVSGENSSHHHIAPDSGRIFPGNNILDMIGFNDHTIKIHDHQFYLVCKKHLSNRFLQSRLQATGTIA
jgi:hypothetical protein